MMGEFHGGLFGLHGFWWLLLIAVVAATVRAMRAGHETGRAASAREILDRRHARGEIDAAEYDERRRRLEGEDAAPKAR